MKDEKTASVQKYYDSNTRRFLNLGHGGSAHAIHRAVWGGGVLNREQAMHYVHDLILNEIEDANAERVLDLGCGVGGSIFYLRNNYNADYIGITLSEVQAEIGKNLSRDLQREAENDVRTDIVAGDFMDPELFERIFSNGGKYRRNRTFDVAFAIESFIHVSQGKDFFHRTARFFGRGSRIIFCDDFVALQPRKTKKESKLVDTFKKGWHASNLMPVEELIACGKEAGYSVRKLVDLSPLLELDRPRDILIRWIMRVAGFLPIGTPFWGNIKGGNALQLCLKSRLISYQFVVLEKTS